MDTSVMYNLPEFFAAVWLWCGTQDPRITFLVGIVASVIIGRIFSLFGNPIQKALALAGFILVGMIVLAFWVSFATTLKPGEIPFWKATSTTGVETLKEIGN